MLCEEENIVTWHLFVYPEFSSFLTWSESGHKHPDGVGDDVVLLDGVREDDAHAGISGDPHCPVPGEPVQALHGVSCSLRSTPTD